MKANKYLELKALLKVLSYSNGAILDKQSEVGNSLLPYAKLEKNAYHVVRQQCTISLANGNGEFPTSDCLYRIAPLL